MLVAVPLLLVGAACKLVGMLLGLLRSAAAGLRAGERFGAHITAPIMLPFSLQARSMKVVSSLKKRCESCRLVKRGKILYMYCKENPRHKARQGPKRRKGPYGK